MSVKSLTEFPYRPKAGDLKLRELFHSRADAVEIAAKELAKDDSAENLTAALIAIGRGLELLLRGQAVAQGIEAQRAETPSGSVACDESPVANGDAPKRRPQ